MPLKEGSPSPRMPIRRLTVLLLSATAAALLWMLVRDRLDAIGAAMQSIGIEGFLALILLHLGLIFLLGSAWSMLSRGTPDAGLSRFVWGRLIRDSAAEALPLSQLGGYVLGARAAHLCGVSGIGAAATTIVDLGVELAGKLPYTLVGIAIVAWFKPDSGMLWPAVLAALLMALLSGLFAMVLARGGDLFSRFAPRLAPRWAGSPGGMPGRLREAIDSIIARRGGLGRAFLIHSVAWMLSGLELWLPVRLMHVELGLGQAMAIDSLVSGLRSFGFFVPGALGVQEGAYVIVCGLFGVPPAIALAISLLRRGRDIAIAIPALAAWQIMEGRRAWQDPPVLDLGPARKANAPRVG